MIRVTLTDYPSEFWPVMANFKINGVGYNMVFESMDEIKQYFNRFYPAEIKFIDKRDTLMSR